MTTSKFDHLPDHLTYEAVAHIIGKSRWSINRALKDGLLQKIGNGRGARITLSSVLRYLEHQSEIATVASTANVSIYKAQQFARKKRQEDRMRRAVELVNANSGISATPGNPQGDPRLEPCVFNGICMSVAERDAILEKEALERRRRQYGFRSVRGA